MRDLNGAVAWITGAGTGIGQAGALALAGAGAEVVLSGRRQAELEQTAARIRDDDGHAVVETLDVTDTAAVTAVAERIRTRWGRCDILVNSAGMNVPNRHWSEIDQTTFDRVVAVNLNGAFYCVQAVLPMMRERRDGLIINISSWAGRYDSFVAGPAYGASKFGLTSLSANLNIEECVNGIRACAICPGEVATEILDKRPTPVPEEERVRMAQPEDLGALILLVAQMPARVCVNEIVVSPTWNRGYLRQHPDKS